MHRLKVSLFFVASHRPKYSTPSPAIEPPVSTNNNNDTCPCIETKTSQSSINEDEHTSRMHFEDELHNTVYVKRCKIIYTNL